MKVMGSEWWRYIPALAPEGWKGQARQTGTCPRDVRITVTPDFENELAIRRVSAKLRDRSLTNIGGRHEREQFVTPMTIPVDDRTTPVFGHAARFTPFADGAEDRTIHTAAQNPSDADRFRHFQNRLCLWIRYSNSAL